MRWRGQHRYPIAIAECEGTDNEACSALLGESRERGLVVTISAVKLSRHDLPSLRVRSTENIGYLLVVMEETRIAG